VSRRPHRRSIGRAVEPVQLGGCAAEDPRSGDRVDSPQDAPRVVVVGGSSIGCVVSRTWSTMYSDGSRLSHGVVSVVPLRSGFRSPPLAALRPFRQRAAGRATAVVLAAGRSASRRTARRGGDRRSRASAAAPRTDAPLAGMSSNGSRPFALCSAVPPSRCLVDTPPPRWRLASQPIELPGEREHLRGRPRPYAGLPQRAARERVERSASRPSLRANGRPACRTGRCRRPPSGRLKPDERVAEVI
jgi:hypothetical protein